MKNILEISGDLKNKVKFNVDNGVILEVLDNAKIEIPLSYLFSLSKNSNHKNLIKIGRNCKVIFVEESISENSNLDYESETEIIIGENSELNYLNINNFSEKVRSNFLSKCILSKGAKLRWFTGHLGGLNNSSKRDIILNGEGADAKDVEIVFGENMQEFSINSNLIHKVGNTKGNILVKNVLKDNSKTDFYGLIKVEKNAQKSDALLQEHSILLSKNAKSNAIPSLEIEANDVRCTHSASSGQIDNEQVFYLMSRGLSKVEARKMIVMGFLDPIINELEVVEVKEKIQKIIDKKWNSND